MEKINGNKISKDFEAEEAKSEELVRNNLFSDNLNITICNFLKLQRLFR